MRPPYSGHAKSLRRDVVQELALHSWAYIRDYTMNMFYSGKSARNTIQTRHTPIACGIAFAIQALIPQAAIANAETQLKTVKVQSTASAETMKAPAESGALGSRPLLDTPFSISVQTSEDITERQVNSLETLFLRDASVAILNNTYSNFGDTMTVRGLPLDYTNSYKINGLSVNNFSGQLPLEAFERVELLKGATGFMYGFAAPGGIVNYVTKKATASNLSIGAGYRSDSIYSMQIDGGTRFGDEQRFGARVNLVREQGDTVNDDGHISRTTAALAFDARLTEALTWTVDLISNDRKVENSGGVMNNLMDLSEPLPRTVNGSRNIGLRNTYEDGENLIALTGASWQINESWSARLDVGHTENNTRWMKTLAYLLNSSGDLRLRVYDQAFDTDFDQAQGIVEGHFQTGPIEHQLVAGVSYQKTTAYRSDNTRIVEVIGFDNLYASTPVNYQSTFTRDMEKTFYTRQKSAFISDTIEFNAQWSLLIGARFTNYTDNSLYNDPAWSAYEKDKTTPTYALLFKPTADATLYASYVEALEQGATVDDSYANPGQLPPIESKQYELGFKIARQNWAASAAVFRIERGSEFEETINGAQYLTQNGIARHDGFELSGSLQPTNDWLLEASAMVLKTEYDKTEAGADFKGNDVIAAPDKQATLQVSYLFPMLPGLKASAGAKYYGEMALDQGNNWYLPDYTLFDASVSYTTRIQDHGITIRGAVNNLTDKEYWATDSWGGLRIGEPRSIALSVQYDL